MSADVPDECTCTWWVHTYLTEVGLDPAVSAHVSTKRCLVAVTLITLHAPTTTQPEPELTQTRAFWALLKPLIISLWVYSHIFINIKFIAKGTSESKDIIDSILHFV